MRVIKVKSAPILVQSGRPQWRNSIAGRIRGNINLQKTPVQQRRWHLRENRPDGLEEWWRRTPSGGVREGADAPRSLEDAVGDAGWCSARNLWTLPTSLC